MTSEQILDEVMHILHERGLPAEYFFSYRQAILQFDGQKYQWPARTGGNREDACAGLLIDFLLDTFTALKKEPTVAAAKPVEATSEPRIAMYGLKAVHYFESGPRKVFFELAEGDARCPLRKGQIINLPSGELILQAMVADRVGTVYEAIRSDATALDLRRAMMGCLDKNIKICALPIWSEGCAHPVLATNNSVAADEYIHEQTRIG